MNIFIFIVIAVLSWLVGVFGWAQVVGGFQNIKTKGPIMLFTIILWLAIIGGTFFVVFRFFSDNIWAWVIGMVLSLIQILRSGKIE